MVISLISLVAEATAPCQPRFHFRNVTDIYSLPHLKPVSGTIFIFTVRFFASKSNDSTRPICSFISDIRKQLKFHSSAEKINGELYYKIKLSYLYLNLHHTIETLINLVPLPFSSKQSFNCSLFKLIVNSNIHIHFLHTMRYGRRAHNKVSPKIAWKRVYAVSHSSNKCILSLHSCF